MSKNWGSPQAILKLHNIKDGILLNIGCGSGALAKKLAFNFPNLKIISTDISIEMVKLSKGEFVSSITALPLKPNSVDIIIATEVLQYVSLPLSSVLEDLLKILKPDGIAVCSVPLRNLHERRTLKNIIKKLLNIGAVYSVYTLEEILTSITLLKCDFMGFYLRYIGETPKNCCFWIKNEFL